MQMEISLDDDDVEEDFHIVAYSPLGTISWLWKTINIAKRRYMPRSNKWYHSRK